MSKPDNHYLIHVRTHADGLEEYRCDKCGRTIAVNWPPHYYKLILEPGDETVNHFFVDPADPHPDDDPYLEPFATWLKAHGY
jgi:hypothetical protein